jgi:hypothetical protein
MSSSRDRSNRRLLVIAPATLLLIQLFLGLGLWPPSQSLAQTPPGYNALFDDSPRTDQLTQADIPNLGRLVMLEAMSMFVHVRSDLADTLDSYVLLNEITTVWHAADAFVAATSYYPTEALRLDAGRLAFPSLETAFERLRDSLQRFPGSSQRATMNLLNMTRVMAVIPPLLGQNPPPLARVAAPVSILPSLTSVRELAGEILPVVQSLRAELAKPGFAVDHAQDHAIAQELEVLENLVVGLDWIAYGGVDQGELVSSIRPIRSLLQRLDLLIQKRGLAQPMFSQWNSIQQRIDALAAQFQLPREIVPLAALEKPPLDIGIITPINECVNQIEPLILRPASVVSGAVPGADLVAGDLRRLRTRLFVLRQYVLGQSPISLVAQAAVNVDTARQQLESDIRAQRMDTRGGLGRLDQSVRDATAKTREQLSHSR